MRPSQWEEKTMSILYKGYLIAVESFAVLTLIILIFITNDRNTEYERSVNDSVNKKINISSTYVDYENEDLYTDPNGSGSLLYLSGAAVLTELMTYDGSLTVQVNNTVLNQYRTDTGEPFFTYIRKYGIPGDISGTISVTRQYRKNCVTDREGKLVKVEYILQ